MNATTRSVLAGLFAAACAVGGVLYAQRVLQENRNRTAAAPAAPAAAAPAQAQ